MKDPKKVAYCCYLVASVAFFISAIINFFSDIQYLSIPQLCLGASFLCLASTHKARKKDKSEE